MFPVATRSREWLLNATSSWHNFSSGSMPGLDAVPLRTFTDGQDLTSRTGCVHLAVVFCGKAAT